MHIYAKRYGAKYDKLKKSWYYEGDIPIELSGLVRSNDKKNISIRGYQISCHICGSMLRLMRNKSNQDSFYGCVNYRSHGCKGCLSLKEGDALIYKGLNEARKKLEISKDVLSREDLKNKLHLISNRLWKVFGNRNIAKKWMTSPKVSLNYITPLEAILVDGSTDRVEKILLDIDD